MKNQIQDLSLPLEDGMITYPTSSHHRFESSILGRIEIEGRETRKFTMGSHCGTHVDAMRHFDKNGATIDQLSLDSLVGEALLINLGQLEPGAIIEKEHLESYFTQKHKRIVLRADWSRFWNTKQYYQDWPYLTKEATVFLAEYLNNLASLPAGKIFLMVSPLKLMNFDGSPARVTAYSLENQE